MAMMLPWSDHEQPDGTIEVRCGGIATFTLSRADGVGLWELRRFGESEVIETDQYRHDLFAGIQSGRIK
ncbi:TPA: hypothetical protein ACG5DM_000797 [Pseudomonas putida]|uniref:Uncharacterized protein n=2 Tax=Pseudomonas TaxID=286 RepID=A0AAJ5S7N0_9PSED|nr:MULTISPECIES: hypothetical protein [Pseudomonas]MCT8164067.1 hypothetical protein [Pseudomonas sp. HD6422]MCT8182945.1 hypothetical protein [Pseudomonas sp. HD6421]MDH1930417.1 hypothetical protein [Pseudomonas sp. GD03696]MDM1711786.1 hypothetical protein [Pseudomonas sp. 165]ORL53086.1 hypothetical protein B7H18_03640 [Pseudomonas putida]